MNFNKYKRLALFIIVFMSFSLSAQEIYVDTRGRNTDGSDWENAFRYLQDALSGAQQGDEICVAQGLYIPDQSSSNPNGTGDQFSSFKVGSGLILRGGYAGLSHPSDPNDHDPGKYKTILSGEKYCYHVLKANNIFTQSLIEGFTITKGKAAAPETAGGGLFCENSKLLIKKCIFENNRGENSGAVKCSYSTIGFQDCQFIGNQSGYLGGAIRLYYSNFDFINCLFRQNRADSGGAISVYCPELGTTANIYNCIFLENHAAAGSGIDYIGVELNITNCTFTGNQTTKQGGVIAKYCSYLYDIGYLNIANCVFWDNPSPEGIQIESPDPSTLRIIDIRYSIIQDGENAVSKGFNLTVNWDDSNSSTNPLLTPDGHLQSLSPCINNGDPNAAFITVENDYDGEARICGNHIDIGADEFVDVDMDNLPDFWEKYYFTAIRIYDANDNPDQDNWLNATEYNQGNNPLYKTSDYFVDPYLGNNTWDGLAPVWDGQHGPKATIQNAINQAGYHDQDRVILAPGVYQGDGNRDLDYGGRSITVRSKSPDDPNTVSGTIIDCQGDSNEPHRGFIFQCSENEEAVVDGITIINGYAGEGGAVYCEPYSTPTFLRCIFKENEADDGGAIYGCNGKIIDCIFSDNTALSYGGGLCDCSAIVINSSFLNNSAVIGGGIANGVCQIINCVIEANQASIGGGVVLQMGGSVINSFINNNEAWETGGIIFAKTFIQNCTIINNRSKRYPAGISSMYYHSSDPPLVINCIIWGNLVEGGLPEHSQTGSFIGNQYANCCIQGWTVETGGENIFVDDPQITERYYLEKTSPCLDAGSNAFLVRDFGDLDNDSNYIEEIPFDIEGNPRRFDNPHAVKTDHSKSPIIDIGCYEVITQGLYIDKRETQISESSDCSFYVSLALEPDETTRVEIQKISGPNHIVLHTSGYLYFTPANYYEPQEIRIRADEDNNYVNEEAEFKATLLDLHSIGFLVHEIDNDPDPDFNDDGRVDNDDLNTLISYWLQTQPAIDIMPVGGDGIVNFNDFKELAKLWSPIPSEVNEGFESGDFTQYDWQYAGNAYWQIETATIFEGLYAAKSGEISHWQASALTLEIDSDYDQISFYYKVSSEWFYDYLKFYIDGVLQDQWSGESNWLQQKYTFSPGNHTFEWVYTKDGSASAGQDCAWIDNIKIGHQSK